MLQGGFGSVLQPLCIQIQGRVGAAESHLTGPQVLSLLQIKPARKNTSVSKTFLWFLLDFMLWGIKCCRPPQHPTCILLQVCPLFLYQQFPRGGISLCVCVCVLKARKLFQGSLPSDFFTLLQYFTSYTDDKFIAPVLHHICK